MSSSGSNTWFSVCSYRFFEIGRLKKCACESKHRQKSFQDSLLYLLSVDVWQDLVRIQQCNVNWVLIRWLTVAIEKVENDSEENKFRCRTYTCRCLVHRTLISQDQEFLMTRALRGRVELLIFRRDRACRIAMLNLSANDFGMSQQLVFFFSPWKHIGCLTTSIWCSDRRQKTGTTLRVFCNFASLKESLTLSKVGKT